MSLFSSCFPFLKSICNSRGQTAVEFMLILPFFLLLVFTTLLFAFMVFAGQMTTYATFLGGRAAQVGGNEQDAAKSVLPGIYVNVIENTVTGTYVLRPLIGRVSRDSSLNSPLAEPFTLVTKMKMHRFKTSDSCNLWNDNAIGENSCN